MRVLNSIIKCSTQLIQQRQIATIISILFFFLWNLLLTNFALAQYIQDKFWQNCLISGGVAFYGAFAMLCLKRELSYKIVEVENKLISNNHKISVLRKHFTSCMSSLHEKSLCLTEDIEDLCGYTTALDKRRLLTLFKKINDVCENNNSNILSIKDASIHAQKILSMHKRPLDLTKFLKEKYPPAIIITDEISTMMFYPETIETAINYISSIDANKLHHLSMKQNAALVSIEIIFDLNKGDIDSEKIRNALEKGRLFALLDNGSIEMSREKDKLIFLIIYNHQTHLPL